MSRREATVSANDAATYVEQARERAIVVHPSVPPELRERLAAYHRCRVVEAVYAEAPR